MTKRSSLLGARLPAALCGSECDAGVVGRSQARLVTSCNDLQATKKEPPTALAIGAFLLVVSDRGEGRYVALAAAGGGEARSVRITRSFHRAPVNLDD